MGRAAARGVVAKEAAEKAAERAVVEMGVAERVAVKEVVETEAVERVNLPARMNNASAGTSRPRRTCCGRAWQSAPRRRSDPTR